VTCLVAALLVLGVVLELAGLGTIWFDLRDIESKAKRIASESQNRVGIRPTVIVGWMNELAGVAALPRRKWGVGLIVLGLLAQTAANLIALWT
jgi:hypothetical protein